MSNQSRNANIDNIKAVLIFLVVFGHLIEIHITSDHFLRSIWVFLYSFHMPMFALVSGMHSKASLDERQANKLVKGIVVPLLVFELLYEGVELWMKGTPSVYAGLLAPYWMLWYLLSLLSWRLLLPMFARLQFPVALAIGLSLLAAYSEHVGYTFSLSRTFVFFPYFLLGWSMGQNRLLKLPGKLAFATLPVVGLALIASFLLKSDFDYRWLYGSYSLHRLEMNNLTGTLYQLLQYGLCGLIGLSFLHLVAQRDWGLAKVGQRSLYVFLWHGLPLIVLQESGVLRRVFAMDTLPMFLISVGTSLAIVWIASRDNTEKLTEKFMLQPFAWLLIKTMPGTASGGDARSTGANQVN